MLARRTAFHRLNSVGMTLVEVMIATAIGGLVCFYAGTLLVAATVTDIGATERMSAEEDMLQVEVILKKTVRQALNVVIGPAGGSGWVMPFDSTTAAGPIINFGLFQREASMDPEPTGPNIRSTGLFFMQPTASGQGVLFIDIDSDGDNQVSPSYSGIWVGHLVKMVVPGGARMPTDNGKVRSMDFEVTIRYFPATIPRDQQCYLPTGCPGSNGHDVTRIFTVFFRDNDFGLSPINGAVQRGLGTTYFFQEMGVTL